MADAGTPSARASPTTAAATPRISGTPSTVPLAGPRAGAPPRTLAEMMDKDDAGAVSTPLTMDDLLAMETRLSALIHGRLDALAEPSGALSRSVGTKVKEELEQHKKRQPRSEALADNTAKTVCAAVRHTIVTTPQFRSADQMSKDELAVAARRAAGGPKKLRELFSEILVKRILALVEGASDEEILDVLTIWFPSSNKKAKTFSNSEFEKMVRGVVHQLYSMNKHTPKK